VTPTITGNQVKMKGPKGELSFTVPDALKVAKTNAGIEIGLVEDTKLARSMWGMSRTMIANLIKGVTDGYTQNLEIHGVGFKAAVQGNVVNLSLGYSHPVNYPIPAQIKVTVEENTKLTIEGPSKETVGKVAAEIRSFYPPEPYKGKGVRYSDEKVKRKEGKTVQ